jgi:hypothetical protein
LFLILKGLIFFANNRKLTKFFKMLSKLNLQKIDFELDYIDFSQQNTISKIHRDIEA